MTSYSQDDSVKIIKTAIELGAAVGNEVLSEVKREAQGVVKFSEDQVNSVIGKIFQTGQAIANAPHEHATEDMFGHLLGPLITNDLNKFIDEVTKGLNSIAIFLELMANGMTTAMNILKGQDENAATKLGQTAALDILTNPGGKPKA